MVGIHVCKTTGRFRCGTTLFELSHIEIRLEHEIHEYIMQYVSYLVQ